MLVAGSKLLGGASPRDVKTSVRVHQIKPCFIYLCIIDWLMPFQHQEAEMES